MSTPFKRCNVWQFRRAVPDDLVPIIGMVEIKQSLKTRDPDEATVSTDQFGVHQCRKTFVTDSQHRVSQWSYANCPKFVRSF